MTPENGRDATEVLKPDHSIVVAGRFHYAEPRWRTAISNFLHWRWAGKPAIVARPEILFGGKVLVRYVPEIFGYRLYGKSSESMTVHYQYALEIRSLLPCEVETGLMRFALDERIRHIVIYHSKGKAVLSKRHRGAYGIFAEGLPPLPGK